MIIRITDRGNRYNGHYGIVYKKSECADRYMVLLLKDDAGLICAKAGFVADGDFGVVPDEENRDAFDWPTGLCDSTIYDIASDLQSLVQDGRKYRQIKQLLGE